MKKLISMLVLAALCLSLLPFSVAADAEAPTNLAAGLEGDSILAGYSHEDTAWNWGKANINDGDYFETIARPDNGSGECSGYHSAYGATMPDPQYIGYNFGEQKTFNTVIAYAVSANSFPIDFEIQVSNDGATWTAVVTKTDYAVSPEKGYLPQTFTFDEQTAQYVRLYATKLNFDGTNYAMKLTEMEVLNITSVEEGPENLAAKKPVTFDIDPHRDGGWAPEYINDGDRINLCTTVLDYGQFAGYHTNPSTPRDGSDNAKAYFTIELGEGTSFDKVVIYPSHELYSVKVVDGRPDDETNIKGIYFPENFRIQVSNDGENWEDVYEAHDYVCDSTDPQVFTFDEVTGKYIRFQMENLTKYIKLTEFEVYNEVEITDDDNNDNKENEGNNPTTGTTVHFIATIALVSVVGAVVVSKKRKAVK